MTICDNNQGLRLTGAETGQGKMAVDWAAKRAQMVCYQYSKKGHILAYCREADRIRIAELEEQLKEYRGQ